MIDVSPEQLQTIKDILEHHVPGCEVRAFGSRFTWTAKDYSDLDLAIVGTEKLPFKDLSALRTAFEESNLSFRVDVLDWHAISPEFQKVIEQGYEVIQKPGLAGSSKAWGKYRLQNLCSYITDGKHGDCRNQDNSGFYFLSAKDVSEGRLFYEKARQITKEDFEDTHKRTRLEAFDILLTNSGTIGRMAVAEDHELTGRTTFQKSVAILKPIKQKVFPRFLYYCLVSRKSDIVNTASGTTQQNLLLGDLRSFEVEIPEDIENQHRIADILSALDEKIELNRQTNATLEAIAQAIFKEWFVDFNFPGATSEMVESELGMIPRGWRVGNILEIADLLSGGTPKTQIAEYWDGHIKWTSAKDVSNSQGTFILDTEKKISKAGVDNSSTKILPALTTILTARGTVGSYCILAEPMAMNQTNYGLKAKVDGADYFVFFSLSNLVAHLRQAAYGTIFDTVTTKTFEQSKIIIPPISLIQNFDRQVTPTLEQILSNLQQSATLTVLRDNLLPKLMSGEIEV